MVQGTADSRARNEDKVGCGSCGNRCGETSASIVPAHRILTEGSHGLLVKIPEVGPQIHCSC
jgi:hypothetical protein